MMGVRRAPRGASCPSDLGFVRLLAGELQSGGAEAALRAHVAVCLRCRERLSRLESLSLPAFSELAAAVDAVAPAATPRVASERTRPPPRRRSLFTTAGVGLFAAAAAIVLIVSVRRLGSGPSSTTPGAGEVRVKGDIALGVVVRRASGKTERIASGQTVAAGDAVELELAHQTPGYVVVLGLDSRGNVTFYVPRDRDERSPGGAGPVFLAASGTTLLPGATALDDAPGAERLFALLCEGPPPLLADLRRDAAAVLAKVAGRPEEVRTLGQPCHEATFILTKAPRP